jgi:hypothetical protein
LDPAQSHHLVLQAVVTKNSYIWKAKETCRQKR